MSSGDQLERRQLADRRARVDPSFAGAERRRGHCRRASESNPRTENLLEPTDPERYLQVSVILARINTEFDYVETDETAGRAHVSTMIKTLRERTGVSENEDQQERIKHLTASLPDAVQVRCGDNPTSDNEYLSAMLVPGEPILFTYESLAHEIASRPLLQRLAKALGYRIVQWEASLRQVH